MTKLELACELICETCGHEYGRHFLSHDGSKSGCAICVTCELFLVAQEDADRLTIRAMLTEAMAALRNVIENLREENTVESVRLMENQLGMAYELMRDSRGMTYPNHS